MWQMPKTSARCSGSGPVSAVRASWRMRSARIRPTVQPAGCSRGLAQLRDVVGAVDTCRCLICLCSTRHTSGHPQSKTDRGRVIGMSREIAGILAGVSERMHPYANKFEVWTARIVSMAIVPSPPIDHTMVRRGGIGAVTARLLTSIGLVRPQRRRARDTAMPPRAECRRGP